MEHPVIGREAFRGHGLGNDYLVFVGQEADGEDDGSGGGIPLTPGVVRALCHRTRGLGSDGIVVLMDPDPDDGIVPLRMFNPDGSEFERSGNGLRILGACLHRMGLVTVGEPFHVRSGGEAIAMTLHTASETGVMDLSVEMGRAKTGFEALGIDSGALDSARRADHPELGPIAFHPVSVGNPHSVVFTDDLSDAHRDAVGAFLAVHPAFPEGTNVQLAHVEGPGRLAIAIWERGVGATEASGTSSCAAAVAAVDTGQLPPGAIEVSMEGGLLSVEVTEELEVTLRGPVQEVGRVRMAESFVRWLQQGV